MNRSCRIAAYLCLATAAWNACGASQFDQAVAEYRGGRYASAWGHFYMAANEGDPDAARIALHMLRYGPLLYGGFWDASSDEVDDWTRLAAGSRGRLPPAFRPARPPSTGAHTAHRRPKS